MEQSYKEKYEQALAHAREIHRNEEEKRSDMEWLFPELKESEGEKVRKALLEMVHDTTGDELWVDYNVHKEQALDWLEKQGKTSPVLSNSSNIGKDEQKPAEWSEEDVRVIDDIFYSINEESVIEGLNDRGIMYALKDIRGIVRYLRNWLQDLKRRVQPQPKQEWSKKDEAYVLLLDSICESSEAEYYDNPDSIIRKEIVNARLWLKSLRPRSTWKPSKEQMNNK